MDRELKEILEKHEKWLWGKEDGKRADFHNADLRGVDLRGINLSEADFSEADLRGADLSGAILYEANFYRASLRGANLCGANLSEANLCKANLFEADLRGANLRYVNIYDTDLSGANFYETEFNSPIIALTNWCPQEGSFIAFKKCGKRIVKLRIPEDAKRCNATTNKCRCDKAEVLGIYDFEHNLLEEDSVASDYDVNFIYEVGKVVKVNNFNENRWNQCSAGIHFFLTFEMAVIY